MLQGIPIGALADGKLPDFGQAPIVPTVAVIGSVLGGAYSYALGQSREQAEQAAFVGGLIGGATGLATYLILLIEGLL